MSCSVSPRWSWHSRHGSRHSAGPQVNKCQEEGQSCDFPGREPKAASEMQRFGWRGRWEEAGQVKVWGRAEGKGLTSSAICASSSPPTPTACLFILPRTAVSRYVTVAEEGARAQEVAAPSSCLPVAAPTSQSHCGSTGTERGMWFDLLCLPGAQFFQDGHWHQSGDMLALGREGPA